jgi:hypothetical protein
MLREIFASRTVNVNERRDKEYACYRILVGHASGKTSTWKIMKEIKS